MPVNGNGLNRQSDILLYTVAKLLLIEQSSAHRWDTATAQATRRIKIRIENNRRLK